MNIEPTDWIIYAPIVIVILIVFSVFMIVGKSIKSDSWYKNLKKAPYNPPNWVFGPAWGVLYILIIISWCLAIVYAPNYDTYLLINWLFVINIFLNMSWSLLFFGDHDIVSSLIVALLLVISGATLIGCLTYSPAALTMMSIYTLWLTFALFLNIYIVKNNDLETITQN